MDKQRVDGFTMEILDPPILRVTWEGPATEVAMQALRAYTTESAKEYSGDGVTRALFDAREATGVDRKARKELTELGRDKPWTHVAFVGVSFELKVVLELIVKALKLMKIETAEVRFIDELASAMDWLEAQDSAEGTSTVA